MYPASHPAAAASVDQLHELLTELTVDSQIGIEVTPNTLLVERIPRGPPRL